MFPSTSLTALVTLVFTLNVYASPMLRNQITSLGLSKKLNAAASRNIAQGDRARVRRLLNQTGSSTGVGATLTQAVVYTTNIDIGVPPTSYAVIVDTGSANTWVGANKTYVQTNSSAWTGDLVQVIYGSGSFIGNEYTDTVSLGQGLDITDQMIGAAVDSVGFDGGIDGILGLGPARLTNGTLLPNTTTEVPTITDNLFAQGSISDDLVAVFFQPSSSAGAASGELTFGGVNSSRFTGDITYTPVTKVSPASNYWGIDQGISYGSQSLLSDASGFVDTGTTLTLIASDAFAIYQEATGGKLDNTTGMLAITPEQFAGLQSIFFDISGAKFEMTPNAQIWPRSLNEMIGGSADQIYLVVADLGQPSGQGLDFINGMTFLERFYSVYDTTNSQVGFAPTEFTNATTN